MGERNMSESEHEQYLEVNATSLSTGRRYEIDYVVNGTVISSFSFMEDQDLTWVQINPCGEGSKLVPIDTRITPVRSAEGKFIEAYELTFPEHPKFYAKYERAQAPQDDEFESSDVTLKSGPTPTEASEPQESGMIQKCAIVGIGFGLGFAGIAGLMRA